MPKPIRVLNLAETANMGGINTSSTITAPALARIPDIEIIYAALSNEPSGWFFERMQRIGFDLSWIPCFRPPDLGVVWRIRDFVKKNRIDVIQSNGARGNFYVRTMLDFGLVRLPTVIIKHGLPPSGTLLNRFYCWADRRPTLKASKVIAVDQYTFDNLMQCWKVSENRLRLVHNSVPIFTHPPDNVINMLVSQLSINKAIPIVLFLGRIEREKGIYELLQAHKKMYDEKEPFYLLVVGEGSARENVVSFSRTNSCGEYIRWVAPQLDVTPYLAVCDLFVLPSYAEGLPFSVLEAMSAGKPVIATRVGGIPEAVVHQLNGILIQPKDVDSLIQALSFMLKTKGIASQMGIKGHEIVLHNFSLVSMVEKICSIYREIVGEFSYSRKTIGVKL